MLEELERLLYRWRGAFRRQASWYRVVTVLLGLLVSVERRTVTASIRARSREGASWVADYLVFSRAPWDEKDLFAQVLVATIETIDQICPGGPLVIAIDDTRIRKTGKSISAAQYGRDPMSPPFHMNLQWGLRYLHAAAIIPAHRVGHAPRSVSVGFALTPAAKKPGKKATPEDHAAYTTAKRDSNLTVRAAAMMADVRETLDSHGYSRRDVLFVGDASFTNKNVLSRLPERVHYLGRIRSDAKLVRPATGPGRKVYGEPLPTPNQIRQDDAYPWHDTKIYYASKMREVRIKEITGILWRSGAQRRPMRLLVVAPTPYFPRNGTRKKNYRDPAYLLTTDLTSDASELLQAYFDRWQIEVVHRELKTGLGVGQAQVWSINSVRRLHSAAVATWSMVVLAALRSQGLERTEAYPERPGWYPATGDERPSQQDILALLRTLLAGGVSSPELLEHRPRPLSLSHDQRGGSRRQAA